VGAAPFAPPLYLYGFRHHHRLDDDDDQHRRPQLPPQDKLRESDRYLPGDVFRVRLRRPARVRRRQLHLLGGAGQEEEQKGERRGRQETSR
jgi:hypothetical protein